MTEVEKATEIEGHVEPAKVIIRGIRGVVKWFSPYTHYGFINREDNGQDVFVHISGIIQRGKTRFALEAEQEVEMDVSCGFKGETAIAVTLPGGLPIENTRIARFNRFNRRDGNRREKVKGEFGTADEGEQGQAMKEDNRQADSQHGEKKRPNKRFGRRRRGPRNDEEITQSETEKDEADLKNDSAPSDKPKVDEKLKKDSVDKPKGDEKSKNRGAPVDKPKEEKSNVDQDKPSAELKNVSKSNGVDGKKKGLPLVEKSKTDQAKPEVEQKKVDEQKKVPSQPSDKPAEKKRESSAQSGFGDIKSKSVTGDKTDTSKAK